MFDCVVLPFIKNQATESSPHPSNGTGNIGQEDFPMTEMSRSPEPQEEDEEQGMAFLTTDCRPNKQCYIQEMSCLYTCMHAYPYRHISFF